MKTKFFYLIALIMTISLLTISCSYLEKAGVKSNEDVYLQKQYSGAAGPQEQLLSEEKEATVAGSDQATKEKTDSLVIRNKNLSIKVKDVEKAWSTIRKVTESFSGKVISAELYSDNQGYYPYPNVESSLDYKQQYPQDIPPIPSGDDEDISEGIISIKVPAKDFDKAVNELRKIGKVTSERELEEDVTEEYIDHKARLKNFQAQEQRYLELFDKAEKIDDILKVEQQISKVRAEIESLQSRIDYLEKSAAMSTISIRLYEPDAVVSPSGDDWGLIDAFRQAIRNFVTVINVLIALTGGILPFLIIIAIFVLIVRIVWRRKFKK